MILLTHKKGGEHAMTAEEIRVLLEAIKKGLEGDVIDRITITIKPKATSK